ncbi:MAG: type I-B CRISPR-associated protein Cas8b/Csh1 [Candidatus Methanomethylicaceae archaeon]
MLGALREIGEALQSSGEFDLPTERLKGRGDLLAKVIFDLDSGVLDCDCSIKCDAERAKEFLWVGNAVGQKPQIFLTTDNPKYLIDPTKPGKWAIGCIIKEISKRDFADEEIRHLQQVLSEVVEMFFPDGKFTYDFEGTFNKKNCHSKEIGLYTACVRKNGQVVELVKDPGYRKFLRFMRYEAGSEEYPVLVGRCHVCSRETMVLTNPSYPEGSLLCIYNVDKAGFMPGLSRKPENMLKAHAVCPECREKLELGLRFVEQKLAATIGEGSPVKLRVFLIPKAIGVKLKYDALQTFANKLQTAFHATKAYKSLEELEMLMGDFMELEDSPSAYFLNLLFGFRKSSHFSFQFMIQDVPVMRLVELAQSSLKISGIALKIFHEKLEHWSIGFEDIFSIFPLKTIRDAIDWKPLVELFNSMLTGTTYPEENIISRAVLFARINRYGVYKGYNINPPEKGREELQLCRSLLKYNLLLRLLREVGVIEMRSESKVDSPNVPDENIECIFLEIGYAEWQKALFLLGVLIGKIGIEQYNKGDEKKAVLNKINFEGMSAERVKLLANYALEGLRNYRALNAYNEAIYAYMKNMLDRSLEDLRNPIDNVFYILSGYAYATLEAIKSRR